MSFTNIKIPTYVNPATLNPPTQSKLSQDTGKSLPEDIFGNPAIPKSGGMFVNLGKDILGGVSDITKFLVQGPARQGASTQISAPFTPVTGLEKFIFGKEPILPIGQEYQQAKETLQSGGYGGASGPLAGAAVFGSLGLNLLPGGGEENFAKNLLKENTIEGASNLLKKVGVNEDLIPQYAKTFSNASTMEEVKNGINSLKKATQEVSQSSGKLQSEQQLFQPLKQPDITQEKLPAPENQLPIENSSKGISYLKDSTVLKNSKVLNTKNLAISKESKQFIDDTLSSIKPEIEAKVGRTLTNKEVAQFADRSSEILKRTIGRDETLKWESAMFNVRKRLGEQAQTGIATKQLLDDLLTVKTQGQDIARKLQSLGMDAPAEDKTIMNTILEAVLKTGANADEILRASEGVNFNDFKQASEFYRKFISPKWNEWLDLLRYNSMLSSPLTHIVNITSNIGQTLLVAPLEKLTLGTIDFLKSGLTGTERKYFAGEAGKYIEGYFKNAKEGFNRFVGVMKGERPTTQLDIRAIPVATKGVKGVVANTFSYPMKLLEGMDQFFTALTQGAERAGLDFRQTKGVNVVNPEIRALESSKYRLFRQGTLPEGQGTVLNAIDTITNTLMQMRNSKNPIVSTISKFTIPFVQTPMNILKQGIEYSPLGVSTIIGAKEKEVQITKAIVGSAVFGAGATLLASGRITGQEPIDTTNKQLWRQANKKPYSIKVGDIWYSYNKLPPAISFPLSMIAIIDGLIKDKKIDENFGNLVMSGIAKEFQFLSDQSYAKSIGDFIGAIQGGESAIQRLISNYPQQIIPFRALTGWMARLFDSSQRKIDSKQDFIHQQIQLMMMQYPGLSQLTPARLDTEGNPIPSQNRIINAFSPIQTGKENEKFAKFLENNEIFKKATQEDNIISAKDKERIKPIYDRVQNLLVDGKDVEANAITSAMSKEDYAIYKKIKTSEKSKLTSQKEINAFPTYKHIQDLLSQGKLEEANQITNSMTPEDYRIYKLLKNKFQ